MCSFYSSFKSWISLKCRGLCQCMMLLHNTTSFFPKLTAASLHQDVNRQFLFLNSFSLRNIKFQSSQQKIDQLRAPKLAHACGSF